MKLSSFNVHNLGKVELILIRLPWLGIGWVASGWSASRGVTLQCVAFCYVRIRWNIMGQVRVGPICFFLFT